MKITNKVVLLAAAVLTLAACSKSRPEQMKMADNVKIVCTPEVLAANGDNIPVQVSVTYPKGYFHREVILNVTPVLVYEGGSQTGPTFTYQGESIKDNYEVVPNAGGSVLEKMNFTYTEGVEKSYLELRSVAFYGSKRIEIPTVKIADGCNVTSRLACTKGAYGFKDDGYQYVIRHNEEGQILYDVNSSVVKKNQLRSNSIKDMKAALEEISKDERYTVLGTQIIAYASPEGGQKLNANLSDDRAATAKKAWKGISKGTDAKDVQIKSIGQDWEGFQEAITASNIQDKELILRVLSMYDDPAVREREIRNMSEIFTEINKKVFPALRRARFVTEVEYQNYTDAELESLAKTAIDMLSEEALLRIATNSDDFGTKVRFYEYAAKKYDSQKAAFNLSVLYLKEDRTASSEVYLNSVKDQKDADVLNLRGVYELRRGNLDAAAELFQQSGSCQAKQNLGTIAILKGNYDEAVKNLAGSGNANEALAYLLAGDVNKAEALTKCKCGRGSYIKAICAARRGDKTAVDSYLAEAGEEYKAKAAKDIEFAQYR